MIIGVYVKSSPEPVFSTIPLNNLTKGANIKEALKVMKITRKNFARGIISVTDLETGLKLSFSFENYDNFERMLWYIRQKLKKERKKF